MAIQQIVGGTRKVLTFPKKGRDYIDNWINKKVLKPKGVKGINGFVFDYDKTINLSLSADITDHFIETNEVVNDHVAIKPKRVILSGFVSELSFKADTGLVGFLSTAQNKLATVNAYLGNYTPQQLSIVQGAITKAQEITDKIDNFVARAKNIAGFLPGDLKPPTKQKKAYLDLSSSYETKQIFSLETPYETLENMIIENVTLIQDEDNETISDITVTLKEVRFVKIEESNLNKEFFAGRAQQQRQKQIDKGITDGDPADFSSILRGGGGVAGLGVKKLMNSIIALRGD